MKSNMYFKKGLGGGGQVVKDGREGGNAVAMASVAMMEEGIISPPKLRAIGEMEAILRK